MSHLAFFQNPSPMALLVILILALLIFGKKLPEVARSLGKGITEFKKGMHGVEEDIDKAGKNPAPAQQPPPPSYQYPQNYQQYPSNPPPSESVGANTPTPAAGNYPKTQD